MSFLVAIEVLASICFSFSTLFFVYAMGDLNRRGKIHFLAFIVFLVGTLLVSWAGWAMVNGRVRDWDSLIMLVIVLAWFTAYAYSVLRIKMAGAFTSPLLVIVLIFHIARLALEGHVHTRIHADYSTIHIIVSVFGESFAIFAFVFSLLYLIQDHALKKKRLNFFTKATPSLEKLERAIKLCLWLGFTFMTLGLLSGAVLYSVHYLAVEDKRMTLKVIWAFVTWGWYLGILIAKYICKLPTKKVAISNLGGFILLLSSLFGLIWWSQG